MPGSMPDGKSFIKDFFLDKDIKTILDVGPGSGNYYDLFNGIGEYYSPLKFYGIHWTAIEIYEPYLKRFNLHSRYDRIIVSDIYKVDWSKLGFFDIIILGDVLEHMNEKKGKEVIKQAAEHSKWVVLSLPIVEYPQGPSYGNIHEMHIVQYSSEKIHKLIKDYEIVSEKEYEIIGAYIFRQTI